MNNRLKIAGLTLVPIATLFAAEQSQQPAQSYSEVYKTLPGTSFSRAVIQARRAYMETELYKKDNAIYDSGYSSGYSVKPKEEKMHVAKRKKHS